MQIPERPFDGNAPGDGAPSYEWLDEWLCEYVDGTMDPSLEAVFEQYVEANPELKAHVERLRQTRKLLGGCDAPDVRTPDPQMEGVDDVQEDLLRSAPSLSEHVRERPGVAVGILSSIAVALVVGFLAGSMFVDPASLSATTPVSAIEEQTPPQETMREEAPPRPARATPTRSSQATPFSAVETLTPQPASAPMAGPDTVDARSTLPTVGE